MLQPDYEHTRSSAVLPDLLRLVRPLTEQLIGKAAPVLRTHFDSQRVEAVVTSALKGEFGGGLSSVLLSGSHLLLFHVHAPWYSTERVLSEELFVRVRPGPLADALAAAATLASDYSCKHVAMGSLLSSNSAAHSRLLRMHGYTPVSTLLIKETTWATEVK